MTTPVAAALLGASYRTGVGTPSCAALALPAQATPADAVILVWVFYAVATAANLPAGSSVTGGGLTFVRYMGPLTDSAVPRNPSGTGAMAGELWWAHASGAAAATVFTVNFTPAITHPGNEGTVIVVPLAVTGCATPSAPWDAAVGLPASLTGGVGFPQITFTLTSGTDAGFQNQATFDGNHIMYGAGALLGADGDALAVVAEAAAGDNFLQDPTTLPEWDAGSPLAFYLRGQSWQGGTAGVDGIAGIPGLIGCIHTATYAGSGPPPPPPPPPADGVYPDTPLVFLSWSDDRGHSFGNPVGISLGAIGEYVTSLQWQRLGMGRSRVFQIEWSSPVRTVLLGAWIDRTPAQT